ncbi:MAG: hypothetical protein RL197_1166 [Actinomycetota bacterium]
MAKKREALPSAEIIAKFDTYENAVEHVEKLLSGNFPVRQIAIVGRGVRTVERLRARVGYPRMALTGALNGALLGVVVIAFSPADTFNNYASTIITFAGIGAIVNILRFSLSRSKRTFSGQNSLLADTYEIQVPKDLKAEAENALVKAAALSKPAK